MTIHGWTQWGMRWPGVPHRVSVIGIAASVPAAAASAAPIPAAGWSSVPEALRQVFEKHSATYQNVLTETPPRAHWWLQGGKISGKLKVRGGGRDGSSDGLQVWHLPPIAVAATGRRFSPPIDVQRPPTPETLDHTATIPWGMLTDFDAADLSTTAVVLRGFYARYYRRHGERWRRQGTHIGGLAARVVTMQATDAGLQLTLRAGLSGMPAAPGDFPQEWTGESGSAALVSFDLVKGRGVHASVDAFRRRGTVEDWAPWSSSTATAPVLSGFDLRVQAERLGPATARRRRWTRTHVGRLVDGLGFDLSSGHVKTTFGNEAGYPYRIQGRVDAIELPTSDDPWSVNLLLKSNNGGAHHARWRR